MLAGCGRQSGPVPPYRPSTPVLVITSPKGPVTTAGTVEVHVTPTGFNPENVEILVDGDVVASVPRPYKYSWDTAGLDEGTYELTARAPVGEQVIVSAARRVTVDRTDRTPPEVVARTHSGLVSAPVVVEWSEPIDPATISDDTVLVATKAGVVIQKALSLSADGRTLEIALVDPPRPPVDIWVMLTTGITDLAGNALPADVEWTSHMPIWVSLSFSQADKVARDKSVRHPALVLDQEGNPVLAWSSSLDWTLPTSVYVRAWVGSEWVPVGGGRPNAGISETAFSPSLAWDAEGRLLAAWAGSKSGTGASDVFVARYSGSAWEPLGGPLSAYVGVTNAGTPTIAVDSTGSPVVAWVEKYGNGTKLIVRRWHAGGWHPMGSPLLPPEPDIGGAAQPLLRTNAAGNLWLAARLSGVPGVEAAHAAFFAWDGNDWVRAADPIPLASDSGARTVFAVDQAGTLYTAWRERRKNGIYNPYNIIVARWDGDQWAPLGDPLIADWALEAAAEPVLSVGPDGAPYIIFNQTLGNGYAELWVRKWDGETWQSFSKPTGDRDAVRSFELLTLAIKPDGTPMTAFAEYYSPAYTRLYVRQYNR